MARLNYRQLKKDFDLLEAEGRSDELMDDVQLAFESGDSKPREYNIREAFMELVEGGDRVLREWQRGNEVNLMEANPLNAFGRITEKVVRGEVVEGFEDPAFIGGSLATTKPTDQYDGERIPGMTRLGNASEQVGIAQPYPESTFTEDYVDVPETIKKGNIVSLAKEHVMADRTGLLLDRAREVGYWLGYDKETRVIDVVLGSAGATYKRRERDAVVVYSDNSGDHDWDNLLASEPLVDWTSVEAMELAFDAILDPNTGEPVMIMPNTIIVPSALKYTAKRILNATNISKTSDTWDNTVSATAADVRTVTESANPIGNYTVLSSPLVKKIGGSATTWWAGDFMRAFDYRENWPVTVAQQGADSNSSFERDIVMRFKASERGVCTPINPYYAVKCTA